MGDNNNNAYLPTSDTGPDGAGLLMGTSQQPATADYESIFGPAGRDIKRDEQRNKRHQRWHLPDLLKGPNTFLTDRVDGLITDATNSPFTTIILPYVFLPNPDAKIKWNVYSFDEGLATRVPYESGARVLTQTKSSHAGYAVRQGLAITMEHNFMMSPAGRENFNNQLLQLVGSIQYTNDLDVHMALLTAPSYERTVAEKYQFMDKDPGQIVRQYVDMFGIMQKNPNGLDIIIEESKQNLKKWGAKEPTFMLVNGKLCMQLNMNIERTQYLTNGYDGVKRLADGPNMPKYRNLDVVNSRAFSLETGAPPRDLLNRRVRVAEYYHIPPRCGAALLRDGAFVELYDEGRDQMRKIPMKTIINHAKLPDREDQNGVMQADDVTVHSDTEFLHLFNELERSRFKLLVKSLVPEPEEALTRDTYIALLARFSNRVDLADYEEDLAYWDYVLAWCIASRGQRGGDNAGIAPRAQLILRGTGEEHVRYYADMRDFPDALTAFATLHFSAGARRMAFLNDAQALITQWHNILNRPENCEYFSVHPVLPIPNPWYIMSLAFDVERGGERNANDRNLYTEEMRRRYTLHTAIGSRVRNASCVFRNEAQFILIRDLVTAANIPPGFFDQVGRYVASGGRERMYEILMVRPCIEHEMLGIVLGRGGTQELGCTFWGQTELSCYDDAFHGKWGMSYKYHERAIVHNEKNLIRLWDVCFNGYTGGMGTKLVKWDNMENFKERTNSLSEPFGNAEDIMCMIFEIDCDDYATESEIPNPVKFHGSREHVAMIDADNIYSLMTEEMNYFYNERYEDRLERYQREMPEFSQLHTHRKNAGMAAIEGDTHQPSLAFMGTMNLYIPGEAVQQFRGAGHLGDAYVGCASVRAGKGMQSTMSSSGMTLNRVI
jgi:hypothetical protein